MSSISSPSDLRPLSFSRSVPTPRSSALMGTARSTGARPGWPRSPAWTHSLPSSDRWDFL